MNLNFTFLGCGTSYGVPMIGCHCAVCSSTDKRDRRTRSAAWIHNDDYSIIFDTGPDLREQAIRENISRVDAVFITHTHADHINGLDDLRGFTSLSKTDLNVYADKYAANLIRRNFDYIFKDKDRKLGWVIPRLELTEINDKPVTVKDLDILPVPIMHGQNMITGYRINDLAYLTDCNGIPESSLQLLDGVKIIVIDGLRWRPHSTHFSIEQAINAVKHLAPDKIYLTHLTHDIAYSETEPILPENVHLAYDGLTFPF